MKKTRCTMTEALLGLLTLALPFNLRLYEITEKMFDELVDEDTKAELIDGVMVMHSPATIRHDELGNFVRGLMDFFVDARGAGKVLGPDSIVHLASCRKFAPDLYYLRPEQVVIPMPREFDGSLDLVG